MREWTLTLPRELPLWEFKSRWTLKFSKSNCKGQNPLDYVVPYIIGKLLERGCLKWASMTHLDISNTSYGQKKGRKSKITPISLCAGGMQHTIEKLLTRATTFLQTSSQSEVYMQSYGPPKLWDKMTFGCWSCGQAQSILQGGRWWLPPSLGRGESWKSKFACGLFMHQKCSNYTLTNLLFLCRFVWVIELLVNLPSPIPELQHAPLLPKCYEPRSAPQLPFLPLLSPLKSLGVHHYPTPLIRNI